MSDFDDTLKDIKANNLHFMKIQGNSVVDYMTEEEVAQIELGYHREYILKAFSDALRRRESLKDWKDGEFAYGMVELALIDAYEAITGEKLRGEL